MRTYIRQLLALQSLDYADESITKPREGGDKTLAVIGRRTQRFAQRRDLHREIALLDRDPGPRRIQQRFFGDDFASMTDEHLENGEASSPDRNGFAAQR